MAAHIDQVRERLEQLGTACPLEAIMELCPELTWNQVFLAIDYLSRTGQVRVTMDVGKTYTVQASRPVAAITLTAAQTESIESVPGEQIDIPPGCASTCCKGNQSSTLERLDPKG